MEVSLDGSFQSSREGQKVSSGKMFLSLRDCPIFLVGDVGVEGIVPADPDSGSTEKNLGISSLVFQVFALYGCAQESAHSPGNTYK